jgi:ABC-type glycerol-3-phosphate transport system substrate-binding protein
MKKPLLVAFLLLTLILGACGGGSLEGEEVTITGALIGEDQEGFRANIAAIEAETGIIVTYQGSDNFEQEIQIQMESGDTPDAIDQSVTSPPKLGVNPPGNSSLKTKQLSSFR